MTIKSGEKAFVALISILYLISYLVIYGFIGSQRYYLLYIIWLTYIPLIIYVARREAFSIFLWRSRYNIILFAAIIGFFQVSLYFLSGLFNGFGLSPYDHSTLGYITNTLFFILPLFSRELLRSYIFKKSRRTNISRRFILSSLFLGLIAIQLSNYKVLLGGTDKYILEFLGSELIPSLVNSMFASYMVILGGPLSSIIYYTIITGLGWYMPILPVLEWPLSSLINIGVPLIGFAFVEHLSVIHHLRRAGLIDKSFKPRTQFIPRQFIVSLVLMIIIIWGVTGLLGVYPAVIVSGSMRPTLEIGDLTIVKGGFSSEIGIGDLIQYRTINGVTITHRVVDIGSQGGLGYFITKGDANSVSDAPVYLQQVDGKVVFTLPKVGWIVIYMKMFITLFYEYIIMYPQLSILGGILLIGVTGFIKRGTILRLLNVFRRILW